jgi:hypothetical protein
MRAIYLFFFSTGFFICNGQYTLTLANAPVPGDIESYQPVDTTGVMPGPGGAGQTWNYTAIVITSTAVSSNTYTSPSAAPNNTLFPSATIASWSGGSSYGMFDYSTSWTYLGSAVSNTMFCTVYGDPATYYTYPFTYGSTSNDTYSFATQYDTASGTINTIGDATGTLQLPSITHNNVLRIKRTINEVNIGASPYTFTGETYFFYSSASKFPLLVMVQYTVNSASGTFSSRSISINVGITTNISTTVQSASFEMYPNPASGRLNFNHADLKSSELKIYNSIGQMIFSPSEDQLRNNDLDISCLERGIYFVKIKNKDTEFTKKLLVE